jgi:hypothetical protein
MAIRENVEPPNFQKRHMRSLTHNDLNLNLPLTWERHEKHAIASRPLKVVNFESLNREWRDRPYHVHRNIYKPHEL